MLPSKNKLLPLSGEIMKLSKMNVEKLRDDFPILQKTINSKPIVYFDNACMTLRPKQVIESMNRYYYEYPACAGRSSHRLGAKATEEYHKSRETVAGFIGAGPEEVIFTKNTTEGINLVANSFLFGKDEAVLTTDKEHNSNLLPWLLLKNRKGLKHLILRSNQDNTFDLEAFSQTVGTNRNIRLVSMVHTSNLDGYTIPAGEIAKIAHEHEIAVMLDCAQSAPHRRINVRDLGADFISFSGHKMLGPTGTGVLYAREDALEKLQPFMLGGETVVNSTYETYELEAPPEMFEAGLQNYAGAIGLAAAVNYLEGIPLESVEKHETSLNKAITEGLQEMPGLSVIGPKNPELRGGIVSFFSEKMNHHDIALMLDELGNIEVRAGMHCVHSWFNAHKIGGSVRASLYFYNTQEECEIFLGALRKIVKLV